MFTKTRILFFTSSLALGLALSGPATADDAFVPLGDFPGGAFISLSNGVSSDGSVIVGRGTSASGAEAFRWTSGAGMIGLGDLAGGAFNSSATAISADGLVIVGRGASASGNEAFRWTSGTGMVGLGDLAGGAFTSSATAVSADGSVIVGRGISASGTEAFRWTSGTGMVGLGDLAGGSFSSIAAGISADGSVIVGNGTSAGGSEAFRWSSGTGMVGLGDLAGGGFSSIALGVSADGSVIVGNGISAGGTEAFRWTAGDGMIRVEDWLASADVSLAAGWTILSSANAVNTDGTVVVGYGTSANGTEAYIARVMPVSAGIITLSDLDQSLQNTADTIAATNLATALPLSGAHHRPVMAMDVGNKDSCGWATVDGANFNSRYDGFILNEEVGLCHDFMDQSTRIGFGVGNSMSFYQTFLDGEQRFKGQYGIAEINYNPQDTSLIFGLLGMYGVWNVDSQRAYLNGGNKDKSSGDTNVSSASVKLSVLWENAASVHISPSNVISFNPKASFTTTRIHADGYSEQGGGFPVRFDSRSQTSKEARLGIEAQTNFNDNKTTFRTSLEGVHSFEKDSKGASGEVIGLFNFDLPNQKQRQSWLRLGVDLDHKVTQGIEFGASAFAATTGQDPDLSGAISLKVSF